MFIIFLSSKSRASHSLERWHSIFVLSTTTAGDHTGAVLVLFFFLQVVRPHRIELGSLQHKVVKSAVHTMIIEQEIHSKSYILKVYKRYILTKQTRLPDITIRDPRVSLPLPILHFL